MLLTGVYRTGSEYLIQLIDQHASVSASMYRVNALRFMVGRYDPISLIENQEKALKDLSERLLTRYKIKLNVENILEISKEEKLSSYEDLYDVIMSHLYVSENRRIWVEKNQLLWREIPDFIERMPNGKAILIIRDPRSVLASFKKYTYAAPPAYLGAIFNCYDSMKMGIDYLKDLGSNRFLLLKYEDLLHDVQREMDKIWDFLKVDRITVNEKHESIDAYGKQWFVNSSFQENTQQTEFDKQDAINRWKKNLSIEEIMLTENICYDFMESYGYEKANLEDNPLNSLKLLIKDKTLFHYFQNWLLSKKGIQSFPTDPLKMENWEENVKKK